MTSTYQPYRPGVLPFPGLAEPDVKSPLANKPLLLAAAVTGGLGAALLVWAILPSATEEPSTEVAPASAVAPADPTPAVPAAPVAPQPPVPAPPVPPPPVPVPPPPVPVPAPSVPSVITFDTGGAQCFPFQPNC